MSRIRLGRHGQIDSDAGDPLDGLVNMFDLGIVLAVAFLIAGLSIAGKASTSSSPSPSADPTTVTIPTDAPSASGDGESVGEVYRLPDGTLVIVQPDDTP